MLVQVNWECTPPYLSTGISNLLQPAQAEVVLGQRFTYLASWVVTERIRSWLLYAAYLLCRWDHCTFLSGDYSTGFPSDFDCLLNMDTVGIHHLLEVMLLGISPWSVTVCFLNIFPCTAFIYVVIHRWYSCLALCYNFLCGDIGFVYPAMSMVVIGPLLLY